MYKYNGEYVNSESFFVQIMWSTSCSGKGNGNGNATFSLLKWVPPLNIYIYIRMYIYSSHRFHLVFKFRHKKWRLVGWRGCGRGWQDDR